MEPQTTLELSFTEISSIFGFPPSSLSGLVQRGQLELGDHGPGGGFVVGSRLALLLAITRALPVVRGRKVAILKGLLDEALDGYCKDGLAPYLVANRKTGDLLILHAPAGGASVDAEFHMFDIRDLERKLHDKIQRATISRLEADDALDAVGSVLEIGK